MLFTEEKIKKRPMDHIIIYVRFTASSRSVEGTESRCVNVLIIGPGFEINGYGSTTLLGMPFVHIFTFYHYLKMKLVYQ
jgi:hypothetical protein